MEAMKTKKHVEFRKLCLNVLSILAKLLTDIVLTEHLLFY